MTYHLSDEQEKYFYDTLEDLCRQSRLLSLIAICSMVTPVYLPQRVGCIFQLLSGTENECTCGYPLADPWCAAA